MYKNMHSYPSQQDAMYHGPHCYPGMETIPTQGYVNPVRPPMGYGYWPWGSSYGGASPTPSHGCCNHSYIPAHGAWGSPYSHVATPHCSGSYPSFPVQYMPPPPYYANMPGEHHCCGCFNYPPHHKEQKNVRIEEEEPEREGRKDRSVAPWVFHNSPDRIGWLPPDYSSNKEQGVVNETGDMRDGSPDVKANENGKVAAHQPTFQNGWLPLDLNNLVLPKSNGDGEGNQINFPYPFWLPYKHEEKEKEDQKEKDATVKSCLETETGSKSIGNRAATKARDIPVKEAEQHVEKKTSANKEKERDVSDVVGKENGEKKVDNGDKVPPKEGSKRKSSAQPKLPPVCLRVDPLPKKKNGNGSSRSSNPLSNKQKLDSQSDNASKVLNSSGKKEQAKIHPNKEDKGSKIIEVVDGRTSQENTMDVKIDNPVKDVVESRADVSTNQYGDKDAVTKGQSEDAGLAGEKNEVSFRAQDMKADEAEKSCKTRLSEEEAAVIIQSAYRGFDVRRWEPIKKLKQIVEVREQIADVKHLIQAMKSSFDIQGRSKQRNIVAETIMSLLLKLDTIQGLTPSIREVRKSVVRELMSLQEQLDSLMNEELENSPGPESILGCDEDALNRCEDVVASQNDNGTNPTDVLEAHQDRINGGSNNKNSETSEADLIEEQASEKIEKEATSSCTDRGVESAPEPTIKEGEKSNEVVINDETIAENDHKDRVLGSDLTELPIDGFCAEEGPNDAEADVSSRDQEKQQLGGALIESSVISEPHETAKNKDNSQTLEVLDLPFNIVNAEPDTEETCPKERPLDDKYGTEEEVDGKTGNARIEPDYTVEQTQNFNSHMIEASDDIWNHISVENEMPSHLLQVPNSKQELSLIFESSNSDEMGAEAKSDDKRIDSYSTQQTVAAEERQPQITRDDQVLVNVPEECNTKQPTPTETHKEQVLKDASPHGIDPTSVEDSPARDEVMENNRRLSEENERLRNMMENLINSGQEQLSALSDLSERVKELEKKLSRKKKLKMKRNRAKYDDKRTVGAAM